MKTWKWLLLGVGVVGAGVFLYFNKKNEQEKWVGQYKVDPTKTVLQLSENYGLDLDQAKKLLESWIK